LSWHARGDPRHRTFTRTARRAKTARVRRAKHGGGVMAKPKVALHPKHPERICWGCDKYCPADDLRCGNGTIRTQHPVELFGEDWLEWGSDSQPELTATK